MLYKEILSSNPTPLLEVMVIKGSLTGFPLISLLRSSMVTPEHSNYCLWYNVDVRVSPKSRENHRKEGSELTVPGGQGMSLREGRPAGEGTRGLWAGQRGAVGTDPPLESTRLGFKSTLPHQPA